MYDDIPILLEDFLNYTQTMKGLSKNTIREYYYDLRYFLRFIRRRKTPKLRQTPIEEIDIVDMDVKELEKIQLNDLHAYLSHLDTERGDGATTRARKISAIRTLFHYLTAVINAFDVNPAQRLVTPKVKKRNPVYLTLQECLHLIQVVGDQENPFFRSRDLAIVVTFLTTGLRLSELAGIDVKSIRDGSFNVIGKGNKERAVYITESCESMIQQYLIHRPKVDDEPALFLSSRKQRMSNRAIQHRIELHLLRAGFDTNVYSTHKLRHTAATLMYKEGVDIRTLQKVLGHTSVATTQIYTHVEDDDVRRAVKKNPLSHISIDAKD